VFFLDRSLLPPPEVVETITYILTSVLIPLAGAAIVAGLIYPILVKKKPAKATPTPAEAHGAEAVARVARRLLAGLEEGNPRDHAITLYRRVVDQLSDGAARRPGETEREFLNRLFKERPLLRPYRAELEGLYRLYERARFSTQPIRAEEVRRCAEAVLRVRLGEPA
jgi:hypothetical protein